MSAFDDENGVKIFEAKVRQWREVLPQYQAVRQALGEARRLENIERDLRSDIGGMLDKSCAVAVDGRVLVYTRDQRNNGMDYELAWHEAMKVVSPRVRKQLEKLLKPKTTTIHKLATE